MTSNFAQTLGDLHASRVATFARLFQQIATSTSDIPSLTRIVNDAAGKLATLAAAERLVREYAEMQGYEVPIVISGEGEA